MKLASAALSLVVVVVAANAGAADSTYPNKPIRLIIPFPPGGSADPLGRAIGIWFSEKFGVPVVGDNRPGAGTAIAHTLGARAAPDGYTLLLGASSGMTTNPAFGGKLEYDSVKDFAPIGLAAYVPQLLVIHPAVPAKTMSELIAVARSQPGKHSVGSPGVGSVGHLSVELINALAGVKVVHVPYKGAGPAMTDLLANRIQGLDRQRDGHLPAGRSGQAARDRHRSRQAAEESARYPDDRGDPAGIHNDGWYGLVAPAGTPKVIVDRLHEELSRALANAEFSKHIETIGMVPAGGTPSELREWIRSEVARWTKVVRDAGIGLKD